VIAGSLISLGSVQAQENPGAKAQVGMQKLNAAKSQSKTVVSGGSNMGTYIDAAQANFGKPNIAVALPTNDAK
jgi:hypothetical protein